MRRIRNIEALDILIAWNKKNFYTVDLKYSMVLSKKEWPAEDGHLYTSSPVMPEEIFSQKDFLGPKCSPSENALTIAVIQSGN
jgi:hypothetical protein